MFNSKLQDVLNIDFSVVINHCEGLNVIVHIEYATNRKLAERSEPIRRAVTN